MEQLCDATVQLEKLEELSVRGTKVSLPHLSRVLKSCPKLTKLDFNLLERNWEEVQAAVSKAELGVGKMRVAGCPLRVGKMRAFQFFKDVGKVRAYLCGYG